jgi:pimeloyl-ACP methyl ester carboxylesterase
MNVVVDGLMTSYQKTGKGQPLIFLHGWADSAKTFNVMAGYLASNYSIIALDLPGFGGSQAPDKPWTLDDYADFVAKWVDKIRVKNAAAFIGHSNGGAIAIKGLASGKLKAEKLILLASAGVRDQYGLKKSVLKAAAKTGKILTAPLPDQSKKKLRGKFYGAIGSDLTLLPHMEETFKKVVNEDVQAEAANLKVPTLLIYGDMDDSTPPKYGKLLHQAIPGSQIEFLTGVGHFLHHEQPDEVGARILSFLRNQTYDR